MRSELIVYSPSICGEPRSEGIAVGSKHRGDCVLPTRPSLHRTTDELGGIVKLVPDRIAKIAAPLWHAGRRPNLVPSVVDENDRAGVMR